MPYSKLKIISEMHAAFSPQDMKSELGDFILDSNGVLATIEELRAERAPADKAAFLNELLVFADDLLYYHDIGLYPFAGMLLGYVANASASTDKLNRAI